LPNELTTNSTLSHYRVISKLGVGGMGEVYLAEDTKLDRKVALKILPPQFAEDKDRMNRFVREAKSASALNHPNIITIHEIGESEGIHFIALEFIDGTTLHDYVKNNPLQLKNVLEIAIQIASALDEAHSAGIVHRDIKPDNVMVRANGLVKILDFGIAKLAEAPALNRSLDTDEDAATALKRQSTSPGMIIGTADYMSPEQAKGKEVDARTDIFSFGVVLYELTASGRPFDGETPIEKLGAILHKEAKPLPEEVPAEIKRIIHKCLRKERDQRYQTIKDLLIDLKDVKQELELQKKLEQTVAPDQVERGTQILTPTTLDEIARSTTNQTAAQSAGRRYATVAAAILLVLIVAFVGYRYSTSSSNQIQSIAVMPFENESGNQDVEYLSDGMTETLIKSLANLPNLNVKPRSLVFRYKGKNTDLKTISKELNVQAILNGRVSQRADQLTLTLELVDTEKESVIWSEQYQRKISDLVALQSEIARDVSSKLKSKLSGAEETRITQAATRDPEAYQAYLKGRYYWNRRTSENIKKAIEQFKFATDRDPNYALAFVGLADCYAVLAEYSGLQTTETAPQARNYAERAIALDPQLAEPHATLGIVHRQMWQWAEAEKEYRRAIELNPNYATTYHWYSILLKDMGRNDEAATLIKRAHEIDPLSSVISVNVAEMYMLQKNLDASIETCLKIMELDPSFAAAYEAMGVSKVLKGQNLQATEAVEKAAELSKRAAVTLSYVGYVYAAVGKRSEAATVIKELEEKYARKEAIGIDLAMVYGALGEKDKAFEWLERDFQTRNGKLGSIRWTITFDPIRDDPRFKDLLKRIGQLR
jgi:serine/threonine protein kinase/Flp pilus assembly protein TadD